MNFRFKGKERPFQYCSSLSEGMHKYPAKEVLCGGWLYKDYDLASIKTFLQCLATPKVRIEVASQTFKGKTDLKERWYTTDYSMQPFPPALLQAIQNPGPNDQLHLPEQNDFIATDFTLRNPASKQPKPANSSSAPPTLLELGDDMEGYIGWWKMDDTFFKPKASVRIKIETPVCYTNPAASVLTELFAKLLKDSLSTFTYHADIAGLSYNITRNVKGVNLEVKGYNHKLLLLLRHVLSQMRSFDTKIDPARFALVKEKIMRNFANFDLAQPYQLAMYSQSHCLSRLWHNKDKLAVSESLTPEHLRRHIVAIREEGALVEILVHGNIDREEAKGVCSMVKDVLELKPLPPSMVPDHKRLVKLKKGTSYILQAKCPNADDDNSAVVLCFQLGLGSIRLASEAVLLGQLFKEPCFNQLRTVEQLGYLVFSGVERQGCVLCFRIIVQSSTRSAQYLAERIEAFLKKFKDILATMTAEEFSNIREAAAHELEQKDKNLNEEASRHWGEILDNRYQFNRAKDCAKIIRGLQLQGMANFVDKHLDFNNSRASLSIRYFGAGHEIPADCQEPDACEPPTMIHTGQFAQFRRGMPMYPDQRAQPNELAAEKSEEQPQQVPQQAQRRRSLRPTLLVGLIGAFACGAIWVSRARAKL